MKPQPPEHLMELVCATSSAYLFNLLPDLMKMSTREQFQRLAAHFKAALLAYHDELAPWVPEPSAN